MNQSERDEIIKYIESKGFKKVYPNKKSIYHYWNNDKLNIDIKFVFYYDTNDLEGCEFRKENAYYMSNNLKQVKQALSFMKKLYVDTYGKRMTELIRKSIK